MTTRTMENREVKTNLKWNELLKIGLKAALFSIISVLVIQAIALSIWPGIVLFKPLDSYPRSALFTLIPAIGATLVFAWLAKRESHPGKKFLVLSAVLLLLSFIPDYALPLENKTFLASSVAAFLHLTAGIVTVATIVTGYHKQAAGFMIPSEQIADHQEQVPGKPEVVIIGAGPAGMFLAYLLVTNDVSVRVLERHSDFSREFRGEGIQPSVIKAFEELGFLSHLIEQGIAVPAHQAKIFMDDREVVMLDGLEAGMDDFGLIVFQEGFLNFLHEQCSQYPNYQLDRDITITEIIREKGRVVAVKGRRRGGQAEVIEGNFFVTTTGRNTGLRKQVGIDVDALESSFDIYWMKFDSPENTAFIPDGFHAYLQDQSMFIFYRTYDQRVQMAWGKRGWNPAGFRDLALLKKQLLEEVPGHFRGMIADQFSEKTERQLLKVACDRMRIWHVPGMLFLGDAAHTMSPVAGQGINLAIRDSIVAANHLIQARDRGEAWDDALCEQIEVERRPEVEAMQSFQVRLGHLMLGAPRLQRKLFFRHMLPMLSRLGIRQRFVRNVQSGLAAIRIHYPVQMNAFANHAKNRPDKMKNGQVLEANQGE